MNRVTSMCDALGAVTAYTYTATGQIETVTSALGGVKSSEYDLLDRLIKKTNELGNTTEYTYDALSRVLSVKNPLGDADLFTYDALDRIKTVTDKNGNITKYNYDANGNLIETIDALNNSSYYEYDAMNRLIKVTLYRKDSINIINEEQITLYKYDKRGLVTREINASGNNTIYVYDGDSNMIQKTDADGYVTEYDYDPRNLVTAINYSGGKEVSFEYNANGELVEMTDWNGTTTFALDILGRISNVNDHNNKTTSYTYDAVGNKTSMLYPDGTAVDYTNDLLGQLTRLTDSDNESTVYAYDAAGRLISTSYPNGWNEDHIYDTAGQLITTRSQSPYAQQPRVKDEYTYDPQGNVTEKFARGIASGVSDERYIYGYDELNRLTHQESTICIHSTDYTYDSLGNLIYERIGVVGWAGTDVCTTPKIGGLW
jgi:YD repeat-containing protein